MSFFNKKEEILEIKLTSYGKQKIAAGTFKPTYYAFFDDDVLYDAARAGVTEDNNDIEPRIQEDTPSLRAQTSFTDLEKLVMKQTHDLSADGTYHETNVTDIKIDPSVFQDYDSTRNVLPLGNSKLGDQYIASWRVEFLEGNFKSSKAWNNDDLDNKPAVNIPQLTCDLAVQPVLKEKNFIGVVDPETGRFAPANTETNQFIQLTDDYLLLDVAESHVDLLNDSFSIEVYEVLTEDGKEVLKPKMFKKQVESIVDGILLDEEEIMAQISNVEVDNKFADFYFTILSDDEIDNKTKFDKIVSREFRNNIFDNNVGYEDFSQTPGDALYTSDNDGDDC